MLLLACLLVLAPVQAQNPPGGAGQPAWQPLQPANAGEMPATIVQGGNVIGDGGAISAVGPGDTLMITVFGQADLSGQATVDADGRITLPLLGQREVSGMSPSAIGQLITKGLRDGGYVRQPQVGVEVLRVRSRVVSLLGEVYRPGRYAIEGRLTLLELLAMAGGVKDGAADTVVLMRPDGAQTDLRYELFIGNRQQPGKPVENMELMAGDMISLAQAPRFFVYGEVNRSGAYPIEPEINVMRALALAGGLTERASSRRISISRNGPGGEVQKQSAALTDLVRPGDVIYVDERIF